MARKSSKLDLFWPKKAKHGSLAPDSTKPRWKRFDGPYDFHIHGKTCVRFPFLLGNSQKWQKMAQTRPFFDQKKAKHGRLAPDSTKASGKVLIGHITSTCMGNHVLGSFSSLATPKHGRRWRKPGPFLTKTAKHRKLASDSTKVNGNPFMCHMTSRYMGKHVLGSFCSLATPRNGKKNSPNLDLFWPKKVKHGRLASDSTEPNRIALIRHMAVTFIGTHELESFFPIVLPKEWQKMAKNGTSQTKTWPKQFSIQ